VCSQMSESRGNEEKQSKAPSLGVTSFLSFSLCLFPSLITTA
jgi:hypothetical protein